MERNKLYYRAPEGNCGDFIPFYWDGVYHLYHIFGTNWRHITTTDFVNFEELGVTIEGSGAGTRDEAVFTGCVLEHDGLFHMFYCGHCNDLVPLEVIMHATSTDLHNWTKDPDFCLQADFDRYATFAFRDAFVFFNNEADEFWMLITAAINENRAKRWGATVIATSKDLKNWTLGDPIYAPYQYDTHECPDMFKMGDKWYLVFSEYTRWWETKYRVSDSPYGPWEIPANDTFDGRTIYAAKTVSNGERRFLVGWVCHKTDENDKNKYMWGGNLIIHEIIQASDGTLNVKPVSEVLDIFTKPVAIAASDSFGGNWKCENGKYIGESEGFSTLKLGTAGEDALYKAKIKIKPGSLSAGLVFRASYPVFDKWCMLKIEQKRGQIYFDSFFKFFDDVFFDEVRPITIPEDNVYDLKIITSGSIFSVYVNDEVALSGRSYSFRDGDFGLFTENGSAEFYDISVLESNI
ncbi:MAG: DUF4975 domain-containing protein [Ruminococcaceae bacterium]|nr:DUF4975 domain-containing protein [Oscillospiraceae bacterium]